MTLGGSWLERGRLVLSPPDAVVRDTQPEDRQQDSQAAISEDPQDVTYAQLNHLALRQETSAPLPSQLGEALDETLYAALAIH